MANEHTQEHGHAAGMTKKRIWQVFFYLLGITAIEFFIALVMMPRGLNHGVGNFIYIALTLLKAYYIIAYFMHLKFEKMGFVTGMTISLIFIVYLIVLLLTEGSYLHVHMNR